MADHRTSASRIIIELGSELILDEETGVVMLRRWDGSMQPALRIVKNRVYLWSKAKKGDKPEGWIAVTSSIE